MTTTRQVYLFEGAEYLPVFRVVCSDYLVFFSDTCLC
jgi:hypothetical protein